jgi:pyruvate ferredoxin oxidoreductase alpha subunit
MKKVMSGSEAVAEAVKLCEPKVIAAYPITPQTLIMEALCKMVADGEIDAEVINAESEQSALAMCIGSEAMGVRSYTATASQGLALMHEILFVASGLRLPIVMSVANRTLSSPLNIWNDQQDSFSERDSGWIQLYVENAQDAFDTHIQAFRIAEESSIPVMVCLDGYVISHTYEPVKTLEVKYARRFLPFYESKIVLDPDKPITMGPVGTPEYFMHFKKQQQDALEASKELIKKINKEYSGVSGKTYGNGLIETINMEGKEHALITIGSVAGTARPFLEKENIGMIKVRSLRPFPAEDLAKICQGLKSVSVLEKAVSLGSNPALFDEVRSAFYKLDNRPKISGFVAGLGGRDITLKDVESIITKIKSEKEGVEWVLD